MTDTAARYEIRNDHDATGRPTLVIWDTQTGRVERNDAGYREEYTLRESAEAMCAYLNLTPEEQAAVHAEAARKASIGGPIWETTSAYNPATGGWEVIERAPWDGMPLALVELTAEDFVCNIGETYLVELRDKDDKVCDSVERVAR